MFAIWGAHAPTIWKIATLKSLIKRAFLISSTKAALEEELVHIQSVFCDYNDYPQKLVETIIRDERTSQRLQQETAGTPSATQAEKSHKETEEEKPVELTLHLPYAGEAGSAIVTKLQKSILSTVNRNRKKVKVRTVYKAT